MKRKDLLARGERIVCSECSGKNTLIHMNGTYICKKCLMNFNTPKSEERLAREAELKEMFHEEQNEKTEEE